MQLGMIGLGRMGASMVVRLLRAGHECLVHDRSAEAVTRLVAQGAAGSGDLAEFVAGLCKPRIVWLMLPAGAVDDTIGALKLLLEPEDIIVDGGNSHYVDDIRRARELSRERLHFVDVGTSGGVHGLDRGYCLMVGGESWIFRYLEPLLASLAPGRAAAPAAAGRPAGGTADRGYLHCGASGAGHFVKMVHNGIEYGLMAAYAEGFNILKHANAGAGVRSVDAETTPLRNPEHYRFDLDLAEIAELWRRGSVISSWLLDLAARALLESPDLRMFAGRVSDSGEGRWAIQAAVDEGVPAPVLSAALYARFSSRGNAAVADKIASAMRHGFGGHEEQPGEGKPG